MKINHQLKRLYAKEKKKLKFWNLEIQCAWLERTGVAGFKFLSCEVVASLFSIAHSNAQYC